MALGNWLFAPGANMGNALGMLSETAFYGAAQGFYFLSVSLAAGYGLAKSKIKWKSRGGLGRWCR